MLLLRPKEHPLRPPGPLFRTGYPLPHPHPFRPSTARRHSPILWAYVVPQPPKCAGFLSLSVHAAFLFWPTNARPDRVPSEMEPRQDRSSNMPISDLFFFCAAFRFCFWLRRGSVLSLSTGRCFPPIFPGIMPGLVVVVFLLILASQRPNPTAIFGHLLSFFRVHACLLTLRRP